MSFPFPELTPTEHWRPWLSNWPWGGRNRTGQSVVPFTPANLHAGFKIWLIRGLHFLSQQTLHIKNENLKCEISTWELLLPRKMKQAEWTEWQIFSFMWWFENRTLHCVECSNTKRSSDSTGDSPSGRSLASRFTLCSGITPFWLCHSFFYLVISSQGSSDFQPLTAKC